MSKCSLLSQRGVLLTLRRRFSVTHNARKEAEAAKQILGRPYKELSIGVPKEVWQNEKRYYFLMC